MVAAHVCDLEGLAPIQRTLAIPLVGRAVAHRLLPALGFRDVTAERVHASLSRQGLQLRGTDVLARDRKIVWGTVQRTRAFDAACAEFLREHPGAGVLTLGVGLCTRAARLGVAARWIEVDVEEVMRAREALLPNDVGAARLACDLAEPARLAEILGRASLAESGPRAPILVIAEGLLMFLDRAAHLRTLAALEAHLPVGSRVVFDYIHPIIPYASRLHGSLRVTGARYGSGLVPRRDLAATPRLRPRSLGLFEAGLSGRLLALHRGLSWLARSPLYEIACLEVVA